MFTTIVGFVLVIEVLFHYVAIRGYVLSTFDPAFQVQGLPLIGLLPVLFTFVIFLFFQVAAILLANRRILKVRPIIALKRVGE